jgi:hypothetical protein
MKWPRILCLLAIAGMSARADELHLKDGSVIVGTYVGGTQKEVYFQHTAAGSDMYPLFMVDSVRFNSVPSLAPGASVRPAPPVNAPAHPDSLVARVKLAFALLFPPTLTALSTPPAH